MRQEGNPLDLNNLPEDFSSREGKQALEDTSSSAGGGHIRKKKSGGKQTDGKDESGKVYECRFCSLKFCKSQALGGHMNRHRQERETETLNRARQLVFSNDNIIAQAPHQLGGQAMVHGGYHHQPGGDPALTFRSSVYSTRLFSGTNTTISPPPPIYTPPTSRLMSAYPPHAQPINDYFVGHVCPGNPPFGLHNFNCTTPEGATNYTCIGAPVGMNGGGGRDAPLPPSNHHRMDLSPINRYQDGF